MASGMEIAQIFVSLGMDSSSYTRELDRSASATQSWSGKMGGFFKDVAAYATGGLIVDGIKAITGGIMSYGSQALDAYAANERLGMSLESLIAKEIKNTTAITEQVVIGQALVELTEKEQKELEKLSGGLDDQARKRDTLTQKISIAEQELAKLESAENRNEISIQKKRMALDELRYKYDDVTSSISANEARIAELTGRQGQLVDVTKEQTRYTLDMSQALEQAKGPAKDLQMWIERLAIVSPFESQGIADAYQMGLAFNFTSNNAHGLAIGMEGVKEAQAQGLITNDRIVTGLVDWAAAAGKTTFEISQVQRALGQMNVTGTIMKQDLNQLTNAGLDWMGTLTKMGYNLDDVSAGVVDADAFIQTLVETMESDFGGAAERQSETWSGLLNSLGDIKKIGLREFFAGTFQAIQPYVSQFVSMFTDGNFLDSVRAWGASVGQFATRSIQGFMNLLTQIQLFITVVKGLWANDPFAMEVAGQSFGTLGMIMANVVTFVRDTVLPNLIAFGTWFINEGWPMIQQFVLNVQSQLIPGLMLLANIIMEAAQFIWPLLSQAIQFVVDNLDILWPILAVVGGGILALTSPISAVVGGLVLLSTAWANNWGGIQEKTQSVLDFLRPYWTELSAILNRFAEVALPLLATAWQTLVAVWQEQIGPALSELWTALQGLFEAFGLGTEKTDLWSAAMGILKLGLAAALVAIELWTDGVRIGAFILTTMIDNVKITIEFFAKFKTGIDSLIKTVQRFIDSIKDLASELLDLAIPDWLTPGSPTPLQIGIEGIKGAINSLPPLDFGINASPADIASNGEGGATFPQMLGNITISISGAGNPQDVAVAVRTELEKLFGQTRR